MMYDPTLVAFLLRAIEIGNTTEAHVLVRRIRATAVPWNESGRSYRRAYMRMRHARIRAHARKRNPKPKPGLTPAQIYSLREGRLAYETAPQAARILGVSISTVRRCRAMLTFNEI